MQAGEDEDLVNEQRGTVGVEDEEGGGGDELQRLPSANTLRNARLQRFEGGGA